MIILYHKKICGAITLVIATLLLIAATLIVIFAASYTLMQEKITQNQYNGQQAFMAADAAAEHAVTRLYQTADCGAIPCTMNPGHYYMSNTSRSTYDSDTLDDGSTYTYSYYVFANSGLTQGQFKVTATGKSADRSATRVVTEELVQPLIVFENPSMATLGNVTLSGTTVNNINYQGFGIPGSSFAMQPSVLAGGSVTLSNSSETKVTVFEYGATPTVTSTDGSNGSDISAYDTLVGLTNIEDLFTYTFENATSAATPSTGNMAAVKSEISAANNYFGPYCVGQPSTCTHDITSDVTGTSNDAAIWVDQANGTAILQSSGSAITIGSSTGANPQQVLLIVNGNLEISGNVNFTGMLFVTGSLNIQSNTDGDPIITGPMTAGGNLSVTNATLNWGIDYTDYMNWGLDSGWSNLGLYSMNHYQFYVVKIPGSWKDF